MNNDYKDRIDRVIQYIEDNSSHNLDLLASVSNFSADARACLEFCKNDPAKDKEGKCKVDLYIPVKKRI